MKTPIFVFNSLNVERGGLTKAVMKRANLLSNYCDEVIFLTLAYQQDFRQIIEQLYSSGQLDKRVKVRNFFVDTLDIPDNVIRNKSDVKIKDFASTLDKKSKLEAYRYYENGIYRQYRRFNKDGTLKLIDYMDEDRKRTKREEYLADGSIVRTSHMSPMDNKPRLDRYFNHSGDCRLSIWINENQKQGRAILFEKDNAYEFENMNELYVEWIEKSIESLPQPVLMSDSRKTDEILIDVEAKVNKVAVAHNNHLSAPYDASASPKKTWYPLLNNLNKFDTVVFLTHEQKEDVLGKFDAQEVDVRVIPHAANKINKNELEYLPHEAVTLARFDEQKRIEEAIEAFKYVVASVPDAVYNIYGFGPLKEKLAMHIKQNGLENHVKLRGFASNPEEVYRKAACSILTSDYEGFGLVLTESLAVGTPTVSYDIKYGPKDIIRDGIDGFLVKKGDQEELARKVISLMTDNKLRHDLSQKAVEVSERFSEDAYKKRWLELFNNGS
ncbi:glycosyltransferase [Terribacillus saccharophilus]|uniref:glycosyltransferase n=1 Tax=Terribacillus saccharophilus TaxID=361277 RepID=UPI003982767D